MLQIVTEKAEIAAAQGRLEKGLKSALPSAGILNIGYRGGNDNQEIYTAGENTLYCAFGVDNKSPTPRFWNSFGVYLPENHAQHIIVEINIPRVGDNRRVAGFFARDTVSGHIFLMHDGAIGGGRLGIGKGGLLNFINDETVRVEGLKKPRFGLPIADLRDPNLAALIWRFTQLVRDFKIIATSPDFDLGATSTPEAQNSDYSPEFSGQKRGQRSSNLNYFTYHGMVVDALKEHRSERLKNGERLGKDRLVDLFVTKSKKRIEVYEVKTNGDRQSTYTAIGQLLTHGLEATAKKFIVLPSDAKIPNDLKAAFASLGISLLRFRIHGTGFKAKVKILQR